MAALVAEQPSMARKPGRPRSQRTDTSVKIDKRLASMARALSSSLGITSAELLSEIIRVPLTDAFEKRFRDLAKEPDSNKGEGEVDR